MLGTQISQRMDSRKLQEAIQEGATAVVGHELSGYRRTQKFLRNLSTHLSSPTINIFPRISPRLTAYLYGGLSHEYDHLK
jgi:hypothetical protein